MSIGEEIEREQMRVWVYDKHRGYYEIYREINNGKMMITEKNGEAVMIKSEAHRSETIPVKRVSFDEAIISFFRNYTNFSERATRSELWFWVLFNTIITFAIGIVIVIPHFGTIISYILISFWRTMTLIPWLALQWRRLHDIGKSGGWCFIGLVPLAGWIALLVFYCTGSEADNQYGARKI